MADEGTTTREIELPSASGTGSQTGRHTTDGPDGTGSNRQQINGDDWAAPNAPAATRGLDDANGHAGAAAAPPPPPPPPPKKEKRADDLDVDLNETLPVLFSKGSPVVDLFVAMSLFVKMRRGNSTHQIIWPIIVYLVSSCLVFGVHVIGMASIHQQAGSSRWRLWRCSLACFSTLLRATGAGALLLFLDHHVRSVACVAAGIGLLVAALLVCGFSGWIHIKKAGVNWRHFEENLKLQFVLSSGVVNMAFGGLAGSVLGYAAVSPQQAAATLPRGGGAMVVAPRFLLFASIVFGLLMVFYCMVPPRVGSYVRRRSVARFYGLIVAYLALFLLVAASVVAAVDITRKMNSTVFFAISCAIIGVLVLVWFAAAAYFSWTNWANLAVEPPEDAGDDDDALVTDTHAHLSEYVVTGYFTPLFSLVMATHSKSSIEGASGSTESLNWPFRILLSLGLYSILAYAVRSVVFAQRRPGDDAEDDDRHARRWSTWATYITMLLTGVAYAVVIGSLKPDELKKIIDW